MTDIICIYECLRRTFVPRFRRFRTLQVLKFLLPVATSIESSFDFSSLRGAILLLQKA